MENREIARTLEDVADLLDIGGANPFRVRAYRNAARTVKEHTRPLRAMVEEGADLTELPDVGDDISGYIEELVETGGLELLDELTEEVPYSLIELTRLPGVGPKKTKKLWERLGVETVDQLEEAAGAGEVQELDGFGAKTQEKILSGIEQYRRHQERFRLSEADRLVAPLLEHLRGHGGLERIEVAGSYRRRKETVGDVDLLAVSDDGASLMERFTGFDRVEEVEAAGDTRGTVRLDSGLDVDLRVLPAESYGAALAYFTGSKEHNVRVRKRAVRRGLRVSEYGVYREEDGAGSAEAGDDAGDGSDPRSGERIGGRTEEEVYEAVDLPWIPPELREDRGEIEAAEAGELPELVTRDDLRGDLQMHTTWSDGKQSVAEMMEACRDLGYEYLAVTDHSQSLGVTGGMDEEKLQRQWEAMDEAEDRVDGIRLLRSMEVDILADGSLDLADGMLEELDVVLVSVHSRFNLPADEQTERLVTALRHPQVDILAHPTGRLINQRDPYAFDLDRVLDVAAGEGVAVELNANPNRLDLRDTHLMKARERGIPVVISTDAHRAAELELISYGVEQARRAWLEPDAVLNTRPADELLAALPGD